MKAARNHHPLVGRTIRAVRFLDIGELEGLYDEARVTALELDDGTLLVSSQDDELGGLGWLFELLPDDDSAPGWRLIQPLQS